MSKTIKEAVRDAVYIARYGNLTARERTDKCVAEIERLLEEAKPLEMPIQGSTDEWVRGYRYGVNDSAQLYHLNIKKILGE